MGGSTAQYPWLGILSRRQKYMWHGRFCIRRLCDEAMKRASEHCAGVAMMHSVEPYQSYFILILDDYCVLVPKLQII